MIYLIYGAMGAVAVIALLAAGAVLGWQAKKYAERGSKKSEEASEEQVRQFAAQQRAFETMLSYDRDTAYGVKRSEEDTWYA